jgi:hypothetical protein
MAYIFDLEKDFDNEPYVAADGSYIIDFALGYDPDSSLIVLMSVMLIRDESGAFELCFGIRKRSGVDASNVSSPDYSSATGKLYVPPESAEDVLGGVLVATVSLIGTVKPRNVIMETFHSHLPPKAMRKYESIVEILNRFSYALTEQFRDEADGKDYWSFSGGD